MTSLPTSNNDEPWHDAATTQREWHAHDLRYHQLPLSAISQLPPTTNPQMCQPLVPQTSSKHVHVHAPSQEPSDLVILPSYALSLSNNPPHSLTIHRDSDMAPNNGNIKGRSKSSALAATLIVIYPKQKDTVRSESRRLCSPNRSFAARPARPDVDVSVCFIFAADWPSAMLWPCVLSMSV